MKRTTLLLALAIGLGACAPGGPGPDAPAAGPGDRRDAGGAVAARDVERLEWAIAIHGGAGTIPKTTTPEESRAYLDSLRRALGIGTTILKQGGTALDAAEKVVVFLEDDPLFNAGRGAVFNREGGHELDASIMDGRTRGCGAVAGVTTVRNPISLARRVMESTRHVLLMGEGAERFADAMRVERVKPSYFDTEWRREQWHRHLEEQKTGSPPSDRGTVGAVVLDRHGDLAAATSTGGLTGKMFGRIGDTPIPGAGNYADNGTCAVSGTGTGEEFIRHNVAYRVSALMEYRGLTLQEAAAEVVHRVMKPGDGGVIAVDRGGRIAMEFSSNGMYRGAADSTGRFEVAIWEAP